MKKVLTCSLAVVALAFSAIMLAGCGDNAAQVIRDGLTEELEAPKQLTQEFIDEAKSSSLGADAQVMEDLGISVNDFIAGAYEGYDYELGEVTVKGDTATVPVTIKIKDMNAFASEIESLADNLADNEQILSMTEDEFLDWYAGEVMRILKETPLAEYGPETLTCTKDSSGTWSLDESSQRFLSDPTSTL